MFAGIHDSRLMAYSVNSETQEVVLTFHPHQGSAASSVALTFYGVAAHCFDAPLLPAILAAVIPVSAAWLLNNQWPSIERGYRQCGWPGPWADTLANATRFVEVSSLQGFQIESSYGLSGWVLARSAKAVASP